MSYVALRRLIFDEGGMQGQPIPSGSRMARKADAQCRSSALALSGPDVYDG